MLSRALTFRKNQTSQVLFQLNRTKNRFALIYLQPTIQYQVRYYARHGRKVTVEEKQESQYQRQDTNLQQQNQTSIPWQQQQQIEKEEEIVQETTESAITPDVRNHLSKVYGTLMAGIGMAAAGTLISLLLPASAMMGAAMVGCIGSLVGIISLVLTKVEKKVLRQNLFLAIGGLMGLGIAPMVAFSAPGVVFAAALGTSAIFGGFTIAALKARRKSMLMLGGVLGGGLLLVFSCGIAGLILPLLGVTSPAILGALWNINLYLGLGIFSVYIAYDTQNMIEMYKQGNDDHVSPALNLFLNIINIFIRLLQIFGRR